MLVPQKVLTLFYIRLLDPRQFGVRSSLDLYSVYAERIFSYTRIQRYTFPHPVGFGQYRNTRGIDLSNIFGKRYIFSHLKLTAAWKCLQMQLCSTLRTIPFPWYARLGEVLLCVRS
jgi:hypothetical protein